ncbi:hypothetical protein GCM10023196_035490 [Actinoallomurus vinaceus]|uniref:Uncharacterized protein n=1 Tax=Actinoallomurus vinaceus TaxID=1080074 RepID=A0ABP8UAB5_9ACTN
MAVTITQFYSSVYHDPGSVVWSPVSGSAGDWLIVLHGNNIGTLADMGGDPGKKQGGWPAGAWQLLAAVDAGVGLPKWRAWATKLIDSNSRNLSLDAPNGGELHSYLYVVRGTRPGDDALQVFSVGAASSATSAVSQPVALYAPDDSGLLIGAWLSGGVVDYTSLGPLTARAELDSTVSTSRAGEQTITAHGPSTRTATASVANPWAAISVVARDATGAVTFPNQSLQVRAELALGASPDADPATWAATWTDITSDVYARDPITITRGRADEASTVGPSTMSLEVTNAAGKYTRLNPTGPYYGKLSKNTPIRLWVNPGSGWDLRYTGFVSEWPPRQQGGGVDQHMPITASGIVRRMNQGKTLRSALYRAITARGGYTAYWPLESDPAAGIPGAAPMRLLGPSSFTSGGPAGSAGAMTFDSTGTASATVVGMPNINKWRISWWLDIPSDFDAANDYSNMMYWTTSGSNADQWFCYVPAGQGGKLAIDNFQSGVSEFAVVGNVDLRGRGPVLVTAWAQPSGSDVALGIKIAGDGFTDSVYTFATADTVFPVNSIGINLGQYANNNPTPKGTISHLLVSIDNDPFNYDPTWEYNAGTGYTGERAADRARRIADEEGLPLVIVGDDGTSEPMGPQPVDKLLGILRDCEAADGGQLYEARGGRLAYRTRSSRYNAAAVLTLDHSAGHTAPPFEPQDDDQRTRNDVTASRPDGGAARVVDTDSIDTVGLYDESIAVNVASDDQLDDQAGWRVHLGTADDYRYPSISPNLNGKAVSLLPGWLALDAGKAIAVTNPSNDLPPGTIATFAEGYTEAIDLVSWTATINASPGQPWRVAVLDDTVLGRLDTDGCALTDPVTSTATTLRVSTYSGPPWTTDPAEMPFDITIGGEQMTVTGTTALGDDFTRTVSNGWGSAAYGPAWTVAGGSASDYAVASGAATMSLSTRNDQRIATLGQTVYGSDITVRWKLSAVPTGDSLFVYVLSHFQSITTGWYSLRIQVYAGGAIGVAIEGGPPAFTLIAAEVAIPTITVAANTWYRARFSVQSGTLLGKVWVDGATEPPAWTVAGTNSTLTSGQVGMRAFVPSTNTNTLPVTLSWDDLSLAATQQLTVTRAVNGVSKSHPAGEDVRLAQPMILAL